MTTERSNTTKTLETLLKDFKGDVSCGGPYCRCEVVEEHDVITYKSLDEFAEKVWNAALDACREKIEGMCPDYYDTTPSSEDLAANNSLREALKAIDSLRTVEGKE